MSLIRKLRDRLQGATLHDLWVETRWVLHHSKRYRRSIAAYVLLGIASIALSLLSSLSSRELINAIVYLQGGGRRVLFCGVTVVLLAGSTIVLNALVSRFSAKINLRIGNELRAEVFGMFLNTDWESLQQFHSGDLLSRINTDVSNVAGSVLGWIPSLILRLTQFLASLAVILVYDPTMAVLALLSAPVTLLLSRPLVGKMRSFNRDMRAGQPILAVENIEGYVPWEAEAGCFALRVRGDSMIEAGIFDGDKVVVRPQQTATNGEIVVALLEDSATVKRFQKTGKQVWLLPENPDYEPSMFVDSNQAKELVDNNTVVIVVDTNKPSYTECQDLLYMTKTIVVLDHHRRGSRRRGRREQLRRVFDCHEAERRRRKAPEQIAAADKQLALSHAVGQRAHQQRRQRGGSRTPADHGGDIAGVGGDGVIEIDVKIHIFDRPGKLADHADENERQPDARGQLFHIRHPPVIQLLRCRSISYKAQYGPQYRTRLSTRSPSRRSRFCRPAFFRRSRSSSWLRRYSPSWRL